MSFITGAVGPGRSLAVLAQEEDEDGQLLDAWRVGFWRDDDWRAELDLDFKPVAISPLGIRPDSWVILGIDGDVLWVQDAVTQCTTRNDSVVDTSQSAFTVIRPFGIGVAAAGMRREVHQSDGNGWQLIGGRMPIERPHEIAGFEDLAGRPDEFYACGWRGEIWFLERGLWHQVNSPTNVILTGAVMQTSGEMIACGRLGTILRGRRDRWAVVDHQQTDEDFWSVAVFRGRTYVSSMRTIYEIVEDQLIPVDDDSTSSSYYHLSANDLIMVSIGSSAVLVTDGQEWQEIF
jgi:hypothetical protein